MVKVLIPQTVTDIPSFTDCHMVTFNPSAPIPQEHRDADAIVIWDVPADRIAQLPTELPHVRLVQTLTAGTDVVEKAGFGEDVAICSGRGLHDETVAEHSLALILAAARSVNLLVRAQIGHRWANELGGNLPEPYPGRFTTLKNAHVVIWGYGSIGRTLGDYLLNLGAKVTGIATSTRVENGVAVKTVESLPSILPSADVLVMILPDTPNTVKALNADILEALPHHAWLINVGRGRTVDHDALVDSLREGTLGGAALDVTDPEPLPVDSPLWDMPNVMITPHAAGGRPRGVKELLEDNIRALIEDSPLRNTVTRI